MRADPEIVLAAVRRDVDGLRHASQHLRRDRAFMLEAVRANGNVLRYAHEELRADQEFVLACVQLDADTLQHASEELRADRQVVMAAVQIDGYALEYASEELQRDRSVVLAAVREEGGALEFASPKLRKDWYTVLTAVEHNASALVYADWELRVDRTFILEAVKLNGRVLEYALFEEFRDDPEIAGASADQLLSSIQHRRGPELEFALSSLASLAQHGGCAGQLASEHELLLRCLTVNRLEQRTRVMVISLFEQISQHAGAMLFNVAQCASSGDEDDEGGWLRYSSIEILQQWFAKDRGLFSSRAGQRAAIILAIGLQEMLENPMGVETREKTTVLLEEVMAFVGEEAPELLAAGGGGEECRLAHLSMLDARVLLHAWFFCNGEGSDTPSLATKHLDRGLLRSGSGLCL